MSTGSITDAQIAHAIHVSLHDDYDGFTIDETSVRKPEVPDGYIWVKGYVGDYEDDVELTFMLKVTAVNVIDYGAGE